jgi:hypothetical protein
MARTPILVVEDDAKVAGMIRAHRAADDGRRAGALTPAARRRNHISQR